MDWASTSLEPMHSHSREPSIGLPDQAGRQQLPKS